MKKIIAAMITFSMLTVTMTGGQVMAAEGDIGKGIGYLIKKMSMQIVLEEFPEDSEDVVEVTYSVDNNTRFVNFDKLEDIQEFDDLEVEYKVVDGQRLAMSIKRTQIFENYSGEWDLPEEEKVDIRFDSEDI